MPTQLYNDLNTSQRILLGPGPSTSPPRVLRVMATPLVGHLDPGFMELLEEEQTLLRQVFQTKNEWTLSISGTGSAGMETALCNFIEPGDQVLVLVMGYFGERISEIAKRYGAEVVRVECEWGQVCDVESVKKALSKGRFKLVAVVHGETSTGVVQHGMSEIAQAAHQNGALMLVDTVSSLVGIPVECDNWDLDIVYTGSQKCLSCPPGLAPITISERAREVLAKRSTPVTNWYLDLNGIVKYWEAPHAYHHTSPISMHFALREGLRIAVEEGDEARYARHQANAELLWTGLETLGIPPFVRKENRLVTLTTARLPQNIDEAGIRRKLLEDYNIEIAGGFGPLSGRIWRIGLMGYSSQSVNVLALLAALSKLLL